MYYSMGVAAFTNVGTITTTTGDGCDDVSFHYY